MAIARDIFKAYDVRGLYPGEINEDAARLIGRGFAAYLQAGRIAVSRDMRLSSPSIAAAFIDGADTAANLPTQEGAADVISEMNAQLATLKDKEPQQILDSVQKNMEAVVSQ